MFFFFRMFEVPSASHQFVENGEKRHLIHQNTLSANCSRERMTSAIKSNSVDHSDHQSYNMMHSMHSYQQVQHLHQQQQLQQQHQQFGANKAQHSSRTKHSKSSWFNHPDNLRSSSVDVNPVSK